MAKRNAPFSFSGKWAGMSVFPLRNVGLVGRSPWGPTAHDIKTKSAYALTPRLNQEFTACTKASKYLRRNFCPLAPVQDSSLSGIVTGYMTDFVPLSPKAPLASAGCSSAVTRACWKASTSPGTDSSTRWCAAASPAK